MTLREALLESNNAAAVLLQQQVGSGPVLRLARDLGVRDQPDVPSLALGSGLVTPLDLTAAYAVFPTLGYRVRPRGIVSVLNAAASACTRCTSSASRFCREQVAFQMVTMLQDVVDRGTGAAARRLGVRGAVGGKTGSTNDYRDAWFVGFSSSVVVGVWVGLRSAASGSGPAARARASRCRSGPTSCAASRGACRPSRSRRRPTCARKSCACISYQRPVEGCPTYVEYFKDGDEIPSRLCTIHDGNLKQQAQRAVQGLFGALGRGIRGIFK